MARRQRAAAPDFPREMAVDPRLRCHRIRRDLLRYRFAREATADSGSYPGRRYAARVGVHPKTARRILRRLVTDGYAVEMRDRPARFRSSAALRELGRRISAESWSKREDSQAARPQLEDRRALVVNTGGSRPRQQSATPLVIEVRRTITRFVAGTGCLPPRHSDGRCGAGGSVAPCRRTATDPMHARRETRPHRTCHTGAPARTGRVRRTRTQSMCAPACRRLRRSARRSGHGRTARPDTSSLRSAQPPGSASAPASPPTERTQMISAGAIPAAVRRTACCRLVATASAPCAGATSRE